MFRKRLVVVGAGPKGLAIAVKAAVLRRLGFQTPQISIVDRKGIASHWVADSGLTNGLQTLGTSPEKDVGFPYASYSWGSVQNPKVNRMMMEFSWTSFLVETHRYSDWVDRGKPAPNHKRWADYLTWVWEKVKSETDLIVGRLEKVGVQDGKWQLTVRSKEGTETSVAGDGLVLTGPGRPRMPEGLPTDDRILSTDKFWRGWEKFISAKEARFAVVGTGETAASIAVTLGASRSIKAVDIISPLAMNYSRGESYVENHVYTDPFQSNWFQLTTENRRDFIQRTDRGVFSVTTKKQLDEMECLEIIPGRLTQVEVDSLNQLMATIQYAETKEKREYDFIIYATGFDPWSWFEEMLTPEASELLVKRTGFPSLKDPNLELAVEECLSLGRGKPELHVPMLAAVMQGPGYPNLSCLGRLSDQILSAYVPLES